MAIRGYFHCVAIFLAASGYFFDVSWLFVAIRGYPWLFVAILSKNSRVAIFPRGYFSKVSQMPMLPTLEIAVKIAARENTARSKTPQNTVGKIAARAWLFWYARGKYAWIVPARLPDLRKYA